MAKKAREAFRTISEVANWLDVPAHVLRFWESKFTQIKPVKRAGGRRYYRPADMRLIGGIKTLLHDDGLTIRGVQKMLKEEGVKKISELSPSLDMPSDEEGAARRTARRARRKARLEERNATVIDATLSDDTDDTPEAPFVHVDEDASSKADAAADNVISLRGEPPKDTDAPAEAEESREDHPEDAELQTEEPPAEEIPAPPEAPFVAQDPDPSSGAPTQRQAQSIAVLKNLRSLEVVTHLADGSEGALGMIHKRLVALRDRMNAEPPSQ